MSLQSNNDTPYYRITYTMTMTLVTSAGICHIQISVRHVVVSNIKIILFYSQLNIKKGSKCNPYFHIVVAQFTGSGLGGGTCLCNWTEREAY